MKVWLEPIKWSVVFGGMLFLWAAVTGVVIKLYIPIHLMNENARLIFGMTQLMLIGFAAFGTATILKLHSTK